MGPRLGRRHDYPRLHLHQPAPVELKYAIHYESTGRLGSTNSLSFTNLIPDFQYLAQNYFSNSNYLKIDGRPIVFIYLTRAYFNTQSARDAVANLRQTMSAQFGINPYPIGDDVFTGQTNAQRAALWDAITDFDVYGTARASRWLDHSRRHSPRQRVSKRKTDCPDGTRRLCSCRVARLQ